MSADRNLLFGILAVQLDFVSRDGLIDGMNAWLLDKAKPLGEVLRDQGRLTAGRLQLLDALVAEHLQQHGGDPKQSLAALSSVEPGLRQSLESLPDADVQRTLQQVGSGTSGPAASAAPAAGATAAGRYRILRPHARGGLGEVFVAEDTELGREVALKEIQGRHAADAGSRTRFVLEAEITGGLEHPGIVPVYGLGTYADGRPFYAMRFIQGDNLQQAIKRFHAPRSADFASLQFRDLLQRFIDVCNAVAYAHSRGVLHRDLKPGNVMLGQYGETLVVDWGLAKATGRAGSVSNRSGDATLHPRSGGDSSATVAGQTLGTPAYMSPEQAGGRLADLGPATDVYSLGATLYELLTGRAPFAGQTVADLLEAVKAGRFPPPRVVQPAVPPALDAVCLKAMALTPADRCVTASDLAREVERFLADEPVTAYPEPVGARLRRWTRKHARSVTAAAAALAVGAAALGGLAWQRERARRAVAAESAQKEVALTTAEKRLTQVERANALLGSVFADLDPKKAEREGKPLHAVLGERLDRATAEIAGDAIGDSLAVARMQLTLAKSQLGLGYPDKAIRLFALARATFAARLGSDHGDTLSCVMGLASGYQDAGRPADARPLFEDALRQRKLKFGPDHPDTVLSVNNLAGAYRAAGKHAAAEPLLRERADGAKRKSGEASVPYAAALSTLGQNLLAQKKWADAEAVLRSALAIREKAEPDAWATFAAQSLLGGSLLGQSKPADAEPLLLAAYTGLKRYAAAIPKTSASVLPEAAGRLVQLYEALGKSDEAAKWRKEQEALKAAK